MSETQAYDDILLLINFSTGEATVQNFYGQLRNNMVGPVLTFQTSGSVEQENPTEHHYFIAENKYFSSRVQIQFADQQTLVEINTLKDLNRFANVILIIETLDDWIKLISTQNALKTFAAVQNFRMLIVNAKIVGQIDINDFYDRIESYIPYFAFSSENSQTDFEENQNIMTEIIEMLANNVWNRSAKDEQPKNGKAGPTKNKPSLEPSDDDFFGVFDKIMAFKAESGNLSPKTRKEKACQIMMNLINTFDEDDDLIESGENNEGTEHQKEGYEKI